MAGPPLRGLVTSPSLRGSYPLEKLFKFTCRSRAQSGSLGEPWTPARSWSLCWDLGRIQTRIRYSWMVNLDSTDPSTECPCRCDGRPRSFKRPTLCARISTARAVLARCRSLTAAKIGTAHPGPRPTPPGASPEQLQPGHASRRVDRTLCQMHQSLILLLEAGELSYAFRCVPPAY